MKRNGTRNGAATRITWNGGPPSTTKNERPIKNRCQAHLGRYQGRFKTIFNQVNERSSEKKVMDAEGFEPPKSGYLRRIFTFPEGRRPIHARLRVLGQDSFPRSMNYNSFKCFLSIFLAFYNVFFHLNFFPIKSRTLYRDILQ